MKRLLITLKEKWSEYFLEVLVITIGILGAFALNTWNDDLKETDLEVEILTQLRFDLNGSLGDLNGDLAILKQGLIATERIEDYLANDVDYVDSMCFDFYWITKDEYTYAFGNSYRKLQNEGIEILRDDTLRRYVSFIHEDLYPRIDKNMGFYPDISDYLMPYYTKNFKINADTTLRFTLRYDNGSITWPIIMNRFGLEVDQHIGYHPLDFDKLKRDSEFQILLRNAKTYRLYKLQRYQTIIDITEYLVDYMDRKYPDLEDS